MADLNETVANATLNQSSEAEIMLSYVTLHAISLLCIVIGSYRSLAMVERHVRRNEKISESILYEDVRMFPIKASLVLFFLYAVIKEDLIRSKLYVVFVAGRQYLSSKLHEFKMENALPALTKLLDTGHIDSNATSNVTSTDVGNATSLVTIYKMIVNKQSFEILLTVVTCLIGLSCVVELIEPLIGRLVKALPDSMKALKRNRFYQLSYQSSDDETFGEEATREHSLKWSWYDIIGHVLLSPIFIFHMKQKHWITNDLLGLAICISGIGSIHLSSFKAGAVLLAGLFVYDIFWVFATDVMVTVAKHIDAPILLKIPHDMLAGGVLQSSGRKLAMLGLGDIVLPGMFIALLLRFGAKRQTKSYFYVALVSYATGLIFTISIMHVFKAGQPALLYLVPTCLGIPSLWALIRGEGEELFTFSEEHLAKSKHLKDKSVAKKAQ